MQYENSQARMKMITFKREVFMEADKHDFSPWDFFYSLHPKSFTVHKLWYCNQIYCETYNCWVTHWTFQQIGIHFILSQVLDLNTENNHKNVINLLTKDTAAKSPQYKTVLAFEGPPLVLGRVFQQCKWCVSEMNPATSVFPYSSWAPIYSFHLLKARVRLQA